MSRPTIAVALHDGFYGAGTGAGNANRAFLESLTGMLDRQVKLVAMPIWLRPSSPEYQPIWHRRTRRLLPAGSQVHPVDNGTDGHARFGTLDNFHHGCAAAAQIVAADVLPAADPLLVIAFDTPFHGLPSLLAEPIRRCTVLVPRSTTELHDPANTARRDWETRGLRDLAASGGRVAAISAHMRAHLRSAYAIPDVSIVDLRDGLTPAERRQPPPRPANPGWIPPAAGSDGFMLAMGRAQPYKGFHDLLDALTILRREGVSVPHLILAAVTESDRPTTYQRGLARQIADHRLDATLVTRFDPRIRSLLAHPRLRAVIVPSRVEPFGRIPLEAYAAGAAPVIATTAGGLDELVYDGRTGYTAPPANPAALAHAIRRGLATGPAGLARYRAAGAALLATGYDYPRTVRGFLRDLAPWALTGSAEIAGRTVPGRKTPAC